MQASIMQPVLRCERCNKPFDKHSTLKRHEYYCRSRILGKKPRKRSCIPCAKAKARCDKRQPECSRCMIKAVECHNRETTLQDTDQIVAPSDPHVLTGEPNVGSWLERASPLIGIQQETSKINDTVLQSRTLDVSNINLTNFGGELNDRDNQVVDFTELLSPQTTEKTNEYTPPEWPWSTSGLYPAPSMEHIAPSPNFTYYPTELIPNFSLSHPRSLTHRPGMKSGSQGISNLILHTLKSYLRMLLQHKTLPPFIHPHILSSSFDNDGMEPLHNCMSLIHMLSSDIKGSRKLFWRNVRNECERLCEAPGKLDKWGLLASMQALSIYILIRLDEGETDDNNFDSLLIKTVTIISKRMTQNDMTGGIDSEQSTLDTNVSWEDWIFEESRRRLCLIYRVVNMLVYFEPAALCNLPTNIIIAPLPAKKQLWEANDELSWNSESQRSPGYQTAFALTASGEVVELDDDHVHCTDALLPPKSLDDHYSLDSTANWEEWCSGMDGLGGLVMLAASLVV